jgi:hypothetical protein
MAIRFKSAPVYPPGGVLNITSGFGKRAIDDAIEPHNAVDIAAPVGTPIHAVADGTVFRLVNNATCGVGIVLLHDEVDVEGVTSYGRKPRFTTSVCHMREGSPQEFNITVGSKVTAQQVVGRVGMTGRTFGPHLHFILKKVNRDPDVGDREVGEEGTILQITDTAIDPLPYLTAVANVSSNSSTNSTRPVQQVPPSRAAISPYIEALESFHPKIQYELTRRRISSETVNTYMPFVKLTSLSQVPKQLLDGTALNNLPDSETLAYCPSLGIHGLNDVSFEDIYLTRDNNRSTVAYGISQDGNRTIPILVANASKDAKNIPIPGITQVNVERSTAGPMGVRGGLMKADLKIVAYSVGQVDALLRYFLRPATRVVLELGRTSSNPNEIKITPFDWKKAVKGELGYKKNNSEIKLNIKEYFTSLIKDEDHQKDFIKQYVYNNYGNYEIFIGYVVKFNLKYNKNNIFEIDLTIHSVQQFEVPTKHTAVQSTCPSPVSACKVIDIQEYFNDVYNWKTNHFTKLISYYRNIRIGTDSVWSDQIVPIKNDQSEQRTAGAASTNAGTRENEYFVSWRFFIEKILNDRVLGIASMLGDNPEALAQLALLRPTREVTGSLAESGLFANQVGYHPSLRSVNPGVMLIRNPIAQSQYINSDDDLIFASLTNAAASGSSAIRQTLTDSTLERRLEQALNPFENVIGPSVEAGASYLTRGIWINTSAIKQAFTSTDTVSSGINSLLSMMNSATEGYWNLQLYSTDVKNPGMHVIDMGLSKTPKLVSSVDKEDADTTNILNSVSGVNINRYYDGSEDNPKYIYMFNRGTKILNDGELGSDLIDLNVEFNMPQVVAVQAIANIGGPAQKGLLNTINVKELQQLSLIQGLYTPCGDNDDNGNCQSDELQRLDRRLADAIEQERLAKEEDARQGVQGNLQFTGETFVNVGPSERTVNAQRNVASIQLERDIITTTQFNPNLVGTLREYADLGTALQLMEINPARMMKKLNLDSTVAEEGRTPSKAHAFNSSNLTKTIVDVTLPGIGGINLFQSFLVDRIPSIIDRGFYVVTKITHEFSSQNGWITKIQGRFRYRPNIAESRAPTPPTGTTGTPGASGTSGRVASTPTTRSSVTSRSANPVNAPMRNTTVNNRPSTFDAFRNPFGR